MLALVDDDRAMLRSGTDDAVDFDRETSFAEEAEEPAVVTGGGVAADTSFDTSFNFGFDFGPSEEMSTIAPENARDSDAAHGIDAAEFNPFAPVVLKAMARLRG